MRVLSAACLLMLCSAGDAIAAEPVKVTVSFRGADSPEAVAAMVEALKAVKGITFDAEGIRHGEKPQWFSEPFVVELSAENWLGELAKAVGAAETPNRSERPPVLNLVMFTGRGIDEPSVMELRSRLREVNGVEPTVSGGLGGVPKEGYYWLQLEDKGGAELQDIVGAVKTADLELSLLKNGPLLGQD